MPVTPASGRWRQKGQKPKGTFHYRGSSGPAWATGDPAQKISHSRVVQNRLVKQSSRIYKGNCPGVVIKMLKTTSRK